MDLINANIQYNTKLIWLTNRHFKTLEYTGTHEPPCVCQIYLLFTCRLIVALSEILLVTFRNTCQLLTQIAHHIYYSRLFLHSNYIVCKTVILSLNWVKKMRDFGLRFVYYITNL